MAYSLNFDLTMGVTGDFYYLTFLFPEVDDGSYYDLEATVLFSTYPTLPTLFFSALILLTIDFIGSTFLIG